MTDTVCLDTFRALRDANTPTSDPTEPAQVTLTAAEAAAVSDLIDRMMRQDYAVAATLTMRPSDTLLTATGKLARVDLLG